MKKLFSRNIDNNIWAINEIGVAKEDLLNNRNQELLIQSIMDFK